ncbi:MAG: acyl-CoA dehydratase activase-related protein [Actinobacteria bacterium]|nr:acyl-CoA dehydratase activase-related protein [Actinomycetota bacterium]
MLGLPRALLYYKYGLLWETFLKNLGIDIVTSPPTSKLIVEMGLDVAESEICMPVKIFYGHVKYLIEKQKVDAVFLPRMVAIEKPAYTCPKFLGLPDMIQAAFPEANIISETFNRKKGLRSYYQSYINLAEKLGAKKWHSIKALLKAEKISYEFSKKLHSGDSFSEAINKVKTKKKDSKIINHNRSNIRVGVAAHSYNIYDEYYSLNLLNKLKSMGATYITPDNVPHNIWAKYSNKLPKFLFWTYERELVGSAFYWIEKGMVDGIIYVMSFACGPDSIVQYVLEDEAKKFGIPMLTIVLDEHSAEAGLITRIEAFIDMLERKKR